jgi:hypothetical protein
MEPIVRPLHILIDVDERFIAKAQYVFTHLCKVIGMKPHFHVGRAPVIPQVYYGSRTTQEYPVSIFHDPGAVEFFAGNAPFPSNRVAFHRFREENVPFIFHEPGEVFQLGSGRVSIRKDLIASAFFFLSCWQEYTDSTPLDPATRYDYRKSIQSLWGFADLPPVDRYADILEAAVEIVFPEFGRRPRWLFQKDFAVTFTHDVDYWDPWTPEHYQAVREYNLKRMSRNPVRASYKFLGHYLSKHAFYRPGKINHRLVHADTINDLRSTVFVLTADNFADPRSNYFATKQREIRAIADEADIGLHGSPEAAFDEDALTRELGILTAAGLPTRRYRSHRLAFDYQRTFALLEKMDIAYDCTLGFWEQAGFRAGSSYPFYPYCLAEDRPFNVLEIPLTAMDVTLHSPIAMNMRTTRAVRYLERLVGKARQHHGHLSFLWHNYSFDWVDYPFWGSLWWQLIAKVKRENAWICSTDELYEYWNKR